MDRLLEIAPQLIFLAFQFLALGISLAQHGKPNTGTENFGISLIAFLGVNGLLYWGGFYNVFLR